MNNEEIQEVVSAVTREFRSFGRGSRTGDGNPIAAAMENKPPMFAAGVDIEEVVRFVLLRTAQLKSPGVNI